MTHYAHEGAFYAVTLTFFYSFILTLGKFFLCSVICLIVMCNRIIYVNRLNQASPQHQNIKSEFTNNTKLSNVNFILMQLLGLSTCRYFDTRAPSLILDH